jgi:hypothetical protein
VLPKKLITLVAEYVTHEDELRADLQQTYGIDLDRAMAGEHTARHIAALVVQLPPDARLRVVEDKDALWTLSDVINVSTLNSLRLFMWSFGDPKKRGSAPQLIGPSWMVNANKRTLPARVLPIDELIAELSKPRGGE